MELNLEKSNFVYFPGIKEGGQDIEFAALNIDFQKVDLGNIKIADYVDNRPRVRGDQFAVAAGVDHRGPALPGRRGTAPPMTVAPAALTLASAASRQAT